jgi:hypothetical protein
MRNRRWFLLPGLIGIAILWLWNPGWAGYKARPWKIGPRESYPAFLTSEGVTIAVEPLYADASAAQVFDRDDMITRGIMPLAIIIFNDNDFPIEVEGLSVELIHQDQHIRTMPPNEVVYRLYRKDKAWISQPMPRLSRSNLNADALNDFDGKFLQNKKVAPHDTGGGFLYLHVPETKDLVSFLAESLIYIPRIYREDDGSRMIFFEIELKAAVHSDLPN